MASVKGIRAGRAYVELGADNSKLNLALKQAETSIKTFGQKTSEIGTGVAQAGIVLAAPIVLATKIFAGFDDQMRLVQAVSGATGKQFDALTEKAKLLGRTTSFTAQEVASGMVSLGRMGFKTDEIDASIASVMDLSRATGTEIALATDIAGNTLRQFVLDASEMGRVCDVLTATANGSAQTLEDLGNAMKYAAPIAAKANLSLEDTAVILGTLANFGIKSDMGGTALRNMLIQIANSDVQKQIKDLFNVDTVDSQGNLRNLADVITEIGVAAQKLPNADQLSIFDTLFGKRPLAASMSLSSADFGKMTDAIRSSGDAAGRTAKQMDEGLGGSIRITLSAIEGLALAIGDQLAPELQEFGQYLQDNVGRFTEFVKSNKDTILSVAKIAATLLTAGASMYALGKATSLCYSVISGLRLAGLGLVKIVTTLTGSTTALIAKQEAEAILTAKNDALKKLLATSTAGLTAAQWSARSSALQLALSEQAEAAAAVEATSATYALKAAMSTLMIGGAVIGILVALGYAAVKFGDASRNASKDAKALSDAAKEQSQNNEQTRQSYSSMLSELEQLSNRTDLTNEEFERGKVIAKQLQEVYGDLGIQIDETTRSFGNMTEAQRRFNAAQNQQRKADLENQNQKIESELKALGKEEKDLLNPTALSALSYGIKGFFTLGAAQNETERLAEIKQRKKDLGLERQSNNNELELLGATNQGIAQDVATNQPAKSTTTTNSPLKQEKVVNESLANAQTNVNNAQAKVVERQLNLVGIQGAGGDTTQALSDLTNAQKELSETQKTLSEEKAKDALAQYNNAITALSTAQKTGNQVAISQAQQDVVSAQNALATANNDLANLTDVNTETAKTELESVGTFDALEAFDMTNDWEKETMTKQTEELAKIRESSENIIEFLERMDREDSDLV